MSAYYNEFDPFAAQWLRNLIDAGHIAPGDVDDRSIVEVHPDDLKGYTQCHFFAGLGGWSHALRLAGWDDSRPVWTGSPPCQPFSTAGLRKGVEDERHLAPVWLELVTAHRPIRIFGEQVAAAVTTDNWLDDLQHVLEEAGYTTGAVVLPACGLGAFHIRQRLWFTAQWMADSDGEQRKQGLQSVPGASPERTRSDSKPDGLGNPDNKGLQEHGGSGELHLRESDREDTGRLNIDSGIPVGMADTDSSDRRTNKGQGKSERGKRRESQRDSSTTCGLGNPDDLRSPGSSETGVGERLGHTGEEPSGADSGSGLEHSKSSGRVESANGRKSKRQSTDQCEDVGMADPVRLGQQGQRRMGGWSDSEKGGKGQVDRAVDDSGSSRMADPGLSESQERGCHAEPHHRGNGAGSKQGFESAPCGEAGGSSGLGDTDSATGQSDTGAASFDEGANRVEPGQGENNGHPGSSQDGTTNTNNFFWADIDWLYCRDGKWRAVRSGTFPLANGVPGRVGRLRAYGNAIVPQVAAAVITAAMEIEND